MRAEQLTVELRARSSWEAVELGTALVRRHARVVWAAWLWVALPVFVLVNAAAWMLSMPLASCLLLWWLKPLLDRVPLFVISRGVFGQPPGVRQTVAAQLRWGWRPLLAYLTWRRFSPARALYLPIELLEGERGARLRQRRAVLGATVYGNALVLSVVCLGFQLAVALACVALVFVFVPIDYMPEAARAGVALLRYPPLWLQLGLNTAFWVGVGVIEPFFVGAGFGLYLNRRTQIEAWDVEIAFRRLRQRLQSAAVVLILGLSLGLSMGTLRAQDREAPKPGRPEAARMKEVFGRAQVDTDAFDRAVTQAYRDPLIDRHRTERHWQRRPREETPPPQRTPPDLRWLRGLQKVFAFIGEWGLWIVGGVLLVLVAATVRAWWPWMRGVRAPKPLSTPVEVAALVLPERLPADVPTRARQLWREGSFRLALALLYRASVEAMATRAGVTLPPGATESQCLRASRSQPEAADRSAFAAIVRTWQYAAYAQRFPAEDEFDALVDALQARYRWQA